MALGNAQRAWTYDEYVKEYEELQAENKRLKAENKRLKKSIQEAIPYHDGRK